MTNYQHYKGNIYTVLHIATHSETGEQLVAYQNSEGKVWVRPYDMFFEKVEVDGVMVDRFKEIKPKEIVPAVSIKSSKPKENYMNNLLKKYGRNNK